MPKQFDDVGLRKWSVKQAIKSRSGSGSDHNVSVVILAEEIYDFLTEKVTFEELDPVEPETRVYVATGAPRWRTYEVGQDGVVWAVLDDGTKFVSNDHRTEADLIASPDWERA